MFDALFIVSIVCTCVEAIKEAFTPITPVEVETHPEPHRDPKSGKIIVENYRLHREDVNKYGAYQAEQWVRQGKYNLSKEEFEKEQERIKAHYQRLHNL